MPSRLLRLSLLCAATGLAFAACGGKVVVDGFGQAQGASGVGGSGGATASSSATTGAGGEGGSISDASIDVPPPPPPAIYAASKATLYVVDPNTKAVSFVGGFKGCQNVTDLAVDRTGAIFGTTNNAVVKIDATNAHCEVLAQGTYPNSLSFVPQGTVDPEVEALVGFTGSTYVRIDPVSGSVTPLGDLGAGGLISSGDMFSIIDGGTFLTVKGAGCDDCLVEVDPVKGSMIKMVGPLGYPKVWGLAYWGGTMFGFCEGGPILTIDPLTAKATQLPFDSMPPFWGAGSSTAAPK